MAMNKLQTPMQKRQQTWKELRDQYKSEGWEDHYRELSQYFLPRRQWFLDESQSNRGGKKNEKIINTIALEASNTLASGMMAGITSPSRPWFSLTLEDLELQEFGPVKIWIDQVTRLLNLVFSRSNVYKVLHNIYRDLGVYGTAAMTLEYDDEDIIRAIPHPIGSYVIGLNSKLRTGIFYRQVEYKVWQVVEMFGLENCSTSVKNQYENGNLSQCVKVIHALEPRNLRNLDSPMTKDLPFASYWWEEGRTDKFLRESGFHEFPTFTPRWAVSGTDAYGSSPGMDVLGSNKSMQLKEKRNNTLIDKLTDPPMQGPASLQQKYASLISGEITYIEPGESAKFEPAQTVHPNSIQMLGIDIQRHERMIERAFFSDLFLMLTTMDKRQMTATEVAERHEEKLLMLGPVLENIHNDLLDPLIDRTFNILARNGLIPPAPPEIQQRELKVEYISILAQAQRAIGVNAIRQTAGFVLDMANIKPDAIDKLDIEQSIDEFADMMGVPATTIRSDDQVAKLRAERAEQQARNQSAAEAPAAAKAIKDLSEAQTEDGSVLDALTGGAF